MKWGRVLFSARHLDIVRAGCKECMYTSTAGSDRTAGRDGQGMGRLQLTRNTPFNPAGGEQRHGHVTQIQKRVDIAGVCAVCMSHRRERQIYFGVRRTIVRSFCPPWRSVMSQEVKLSPTLLHLLFICSRLVKPSYCMQDEAQVLIMRGRCSVKGQDHRRNSHDYTAICTCSHAQSSA